MKRNSFLILALMLTLVYQTACLSMMFGTNKEVGSEKSALLSEEKSSKAQSISNLNFKDINGKAYTREDLNGKVVLVVYWATWCPPCRREIPVLNELHKKFSSRGALILSVSQDDSVDTVKDFLKKQEMLYPVVYGGDYLDQFGQVSALPTMILIDKTGKVIKKHVGMAPPDALEKAIEAQL